MLVRFTAARGSFRVGDETNHLTDRTAYRLLAEGVVKRLDLERLMLYDQPSMAKLSLCAPLLLRKVMAAMDDLGTDGTYFRVAQGLRTAQEQNALFAQGRTAPGHIVTNAPAGYSNHNFGCAVDCYPFLSGPVGDLNWNAGTPQFEAMVRALKAQGLAWGGDWRSIVDPPHFQLTNVPATPTDADRALLDADGLHAVWEHYNAL